MSNGTLPPLSSYHLNEHQTTFALQQTVEHWMTSGASVEELLQAVEDLAEGKERRFDEATGWCCWFGGGCCC